MELRTALSAWAERTFGGIHVQDFFDMNEQVLATKQSGVYQRKIALSLRKSEGVKKDWTSEEAFDRWRRELQEIIGTEGLIKFDLKSAEGNEVNYVAGLREGKKGEEEFNDARARIFTYRFTLSVVKRVARHGG